MRTIPHGLECTQDLPVCMLRRARDPEIALLLTLLRCVFFQMSLEQLQQGFEARAWRGSAIDGAVEQVNPRRRCTVVLCAHVMLCTTVVARARSTLFACWFCWNISWRIDVPENHGGFVHGFARLEDGACEDNGLLKENRCPGGLLRDRLFRSADEYCSSV